LTEWRTIPGFERYEVSDDGRVRFIATKRERTLRANYRGYMTVAMIAGPPAPRENGVRSPSKTMRVHRLVALAFIPNPDGKPQVNHRDLDRANNCVPNLEWATQQDNHDHARSTGIYDASQHEGRWKKLTPDDVIALRDKRRAGASFPSLAREYGITSSTATKIASGRYWPTVPGAIAPSPSTRTDR